MDIAAGCSIVRSNMNFLRMAMRFGKPQNLINAINRRHKVLNKNDILSVLKSLSDAALILFFITDHPLFFYKLGYLPMSLQMNDQIDYWNNVFWLVNTIAEIFLEAVGQNQRLSEKIYGISVNASDLPIIFFYMNWWPEIYGQKYAGACGAICSLVGLIRMY